MHSQRERETMEFFHNQGPCLNINYIAFSIRVSKLNFNKLSLTDGHGLLAEAKHLFV